MFSQLHHFSKNFSTANILGMVLTLIGLIIGAVNVADAYSTAQTNTAQTSTSQTNTSQTDADTASTPTNSTGLSSNTGLSSMVSNAADLATGKPVTVEQGMRISMSGEDDSLLALVRPLQFCTLGYIDHENRVGYTSAHCLPGVDEGTYNGGGVIVTTREQRPIGTAYPANSYRENDANDTDVAIIHFNNDVKLGKNIYSGNTVLTPEDINIEKDTFCAFGATTQRVQCGKWNTNMGGTNPTTAFYVFGANTIDGDSGSGVWVRDEGGKSRGLLGISRGRYHIDAPNAAGAILASVDPNDFERPAGK